MKTGRQKGDDRLKGKKEENSAPPVGLEPTTSCLHDKGTTMLEPCLLQSVQDIGGGVGISVCSSDKYKPTEIISGRVTTENSLYKFLMGSSRSFPEGSEGPP